jgi:hypothetical protein
MFVGFFSVAIGTPIQRRKQLGRSLPTLAGRGVAGVRVERSSAPLLGKLGSGSKNPEHLLCNRKPATVAAFNRDDRRLRHSNLTGELALPKASPATKQSNLPAERRTIRKVATNQLKR